jgi:hexosaminidase
MSHLTSVWPRAILCAMPLVLPWVQGAAPAPAHHLMPTPATIRWQTGRVPITATATAAVRCSAGPRLRAAVDRTMRRLEGRTGYTLARALSADAATATLVVECRGPGRTIPALDEDESYTLEAGGGRVTIRAATDVGALRGLETFLQLLSGDRDGFFIPAVQIEDRPRFRWRGLLIDVGRHFEPVEVIKRELDAMAAVKLNVLHFHLSEDQGFRVESRRYPKLHELGSDGQYYTQEQLRDIVAYAAMRGIRVVPEFDMPGHVTSWLVGYPELGSAPGPYEIIRGFGVFDGAFDPTRESTYRFIDRFIGEMAPIFPDAYWHIGGDENNGKHWQANPAIQAFMEQRRIADAHALQTHFNQRLLTILRKHGKRMMGWDEILQPGLPKETVIHSWRGQRSLIDAARQGYDGVLSAGYYIDLLQTSATHYAVDPLPATSDLTPAEAAHILGGEATMWGEWVGPETIDSRLWPRVAAIAERFWSPREVADVDDMYRRLAHVSIQLEELGLTHERNRGVLLRRLAGTADIAPLEVLAGVVEPVKGYQRGSHQRGTTFLPLTHLVDAVSTDSLGARRMSRLIDGVLSDAPRFAAGRDELAGVFASWRDARPRLEALIDRAPALRETAPLARDLGDLGAIGQEALAFLAVRGTPLPDWRERTIAALDQATRPKAALEFPFSRAMRELVFAALEHAQLGQLAPAEWRARIRELAAPPRRGRGGFPGLDSDR